MPKKSIRVKPTLPPRPQICYNFDTKLLHISRSFLVLSYLGRHFHFHENLDHPDRYLYLVLEYPFPHLVMNLLDWGPRNLAADLLDYGFLSLVVDLQDRGGLDLEEDQDPDHRVSFLK
ncbi:hypothetical protein PF005_g24249 [Phytophthora fragariae]|uniref:Uncharacterized protein n=4 Tax=Phytophthora TaxID=4783 RepID=A0A6A3WU42_9STRA|nr:hypothetical protein PF009_g26163 [Phytophthora fragariae]KAE8979443.1 hypothetical protein PR002_g24413 [Phytophthora rubi]KAE8978031.1 hypothetical protein PF011_g23412 [Phytophthora fragariae]KAE9178037.1 hypothetical protein PF005_g24249 [Phytophthora fragariae]KAE9190769.1 hypothetical protein PF002_g24676 [Phytophthora fragariae]